MKNFEEITNIEESFDPFLEKLWKKYRFPYHPPFKDTVAEKRLRDVCEKYTDFVDNPENWKTQIDMMEDSENYFSHVKKPNQSSDSRRRELHNQIAIMTVGEQRTGMNEGMATKIADFAREYTTGK